MADDKHPVSNGDEALVHLLADLGPVMLRQRTAEAMEPNADFAHRLHMRLLNEELSPVSTVEAAKSERTRPVVGAAFRRWVSHRHRQRRTALATAGLALALIALVIALRLPSGLHGNGRTAVLLPRPSFRDLTRGYPDLRFGLGSGGAAESPLSSPVEERSNRPYHGHFSVAVRPVPSVSHSAKAYLLRPPNTGTAHMARLARLLGIRSPTRTIRVGHGTWQVTAYRGKSPAGQQLHSIALSSSTGELIYRDVSNGSFLGRQGLDRRHALAAARAWLERLGWPATRMPLQSAEPMPYVPSVWTIKFGWPGTGATATPEAALEIVPGGAVAEAAIWPLPERAYPVPLVSMGSALNDLRAGRVPLAVSIVPQVSLAHSSGHGRLIHVTIERVLSSDERGRLYLVPVYRLAGTVQLRVIRSRAVRKPSRYVTVPGQWYGLVSAVDRS